MSRFSNPLNNVRVASPCNTDWNEMIGNERRRFCGQCNLNVYNLSDMSRAEAERLVAQNEGRLCVRFYQRRDGTIITDNCPVGLRAIRRRLSRVFSAVASAVISFIAGLGLYQLNSMAEVQMRPHVMGTMAEAPPILMGEPVVLGNLVVDTPLVMGRIASRRSPLVTASRKRK